MIADEAVKSGYRSNKPGSTTEKVHHSFWSTMKRNEDVFQAAGRGRFSLKSKMNVSRRTAQSDDHDVSETVHATSLGVQQETATTGR